jgi:hypothetical protein
MQKWTWGLVFEFGKKMSEIRTPEYAFENLLKFQIYISVRNSVTFFDANTGIAGRRVLKCREIIVSLAIESERIMWVGEDHFTGRGSG